MHTVEIRCGQKENTGSALTELRIWLDSHRCETSRFDFERRSGEAVVRLHFAIPEQASLFAAAFQGRILSRTASDVTPSPVQNGVPPLNGARLVVGVAALAAR